VIVSVNQAPVGSVAALTEAVDGARAKHRKSVLLLVDRDGDQRFVTIELSDA
jgi:serine protease Do